MLDDKTLARLDALALRLKNRTRGAAGGAVLLAELLAKKGYFD